MRTDMTASPSKVPEVTLAFWIVKIAATTLGETAGDTLSMTLQWGYLASTALFVVALVVLVGFQIAASQFRPFLYWATIIASTTFGTTMADFADRSLGIGYAGGSSILLLCLAATFGLWYWSLGSISVDTVNTPKVEAFYWAAITFSQTLGTALGDWTADSTGLGYDGGALVLGTAIGGCRGGLLLDPCVARHAVLDGVHSNPAAGSDRRRFPRQARQRRRPCLEPPACFGCHRGLHPRLPADSAATGRLASGSIAGDRRQPRLSVRDAPNH